MRPVTASVHLTPSGGTSSIRSGVVSSRSRGGTTSVVSSIRPFTSNRSSRLATSTGKHAASLPTQADVKIKQRPVTAAGGLGGLTQKSSNQRLLTRQNQDASYYFGLLKSKEIDIINEIEVLNEKVQKMENDSLSQGDVEASYQSLLKDVRELEGTLADYNVANDRLRQGFDPEDMEIRHDELKVQNEKLSQELDEIFVSKQQCETNVVRIEKDIEAMHESIKRRLQDTADPALLNDYEEHMVQIQNLQAERKRIEEQLDQMKNKFHRLEVIQSNDDNFERRKLYQLAEDQIEKLKVDLLQIDEDLHIAQMKPEEAHGYLLENVKSIQAKVKELTKQETQITDEIQNLKDIQDNFQSQEIDESNPFAFRKTAKGNKMQYNEEEIDKSIHISKETMSELANDHKKKQNEIVALLEDLNEHLKSRDNSSPTEEGLRELNMDVDFRTKHLVNSQQTMKRLLDQKEKRIRELQMVENLEGKIRSEEEELRMKIEDMETDNAHHSDINQLQETAEITKDYLIQMKDRYIQRRDFLSRKVKDISAEYRKNKQKLDNSETWQSLLQLEEKIRRQGQVVFSLHQFVRTKEQQTNYEGEKNECLRMMNDLQYSQ